jgi:hypothetical protein
MIFIFTPLFSSFDYFIFTPRCCYRPPRHADCSPSPPRWRHISLPIGCRFSLFALRRFAFRHFFPIADISPLRHDTFAFASDAAAMTPGCHFHFAIIFDAGHNSPPLDAAARLSLRFHCRQFSMLAIGHFHAAIISLISLLIFAFAIELPAFQLTLRYFHCFIADIYYADISHFIFRYATFSLMRAASAADAADG